MSKNIKSIFKLFQTENLTRLSVIILIFCKRQSPASHRTQKTVSSPDVYVKQLMELRGEGVLRLVPVDPVE